MKSLLLLLLTTHAMAQTPQPAPEYSVSINGETHYTANQPSGGNIVFETMNTQSSQTPILKIPKSTKFDDLTISQSLTNTEVFANQFNTAVKGPFTSSTAPLSLLIAKSVSGQISFTEYSQLHIKSLTLPELNATTREILNLTYTLSVGQQVTPKPILPIKAINRPSAISSNFSFSINSRNISAVQISPIKVLFSGDSSVSSEVRNFTAIVNASEVAFLQDLQNKQIKNLGTMNDLADAKITYLNPSLTTALYTVQISKLGVVAIRAIPTTNAIQRFEVELFASKIELIKN